MLIIENVVADDLVAIKELQPATWDDIIPRIRYFINSPFCTVLKTVVDGQIVGVGAVLFHKDSAWLANIITHEAHRNKGIGYAITDALLSCIDKSVYTTIYLDATDLGYPVYLKFGFEVEGFYNHFTTISNLIFDKNAHIIPYDANYIESVLDLDFKVTSEYRVQKLAEGFADAVMYVTNKKLRGVYFPNVGEGLIIAHDNEAGIALMKRKAVTAIKAVIPQNNSAANTFLTDNKFSLLKSSRRMRLGVKREWRPEFLFNRISGQLG